MGRIYTVQFSELARTTSTDLIELTAVSSGIVLLHEVGVSQKLDIGDAEEEMLLLQWKQGVTTGSGGSPGIEEKSGGNNQATATTVTETGNTTKATGGEARYSWYWNIRIPFQYIWTPETRPTLNPSETGVFTLLTTPTDSITLAAYAVWEEIG